jgi:hypothetical protein
MTPLNRILRHGIPTALILGCLGYIFAQFAGVWYQDHAGDRDAPTGGFEVTESLQWTMPITMALWGIGVVVAMEFARWLWRTWFPKPTVSTSAPGPDAEQLLLKLLDEAETAERERNSLGENNSHRLTHS